MQGIKSLSENAEVERRGVALLNNISAGKGLANVLKSNLGPKGTLKMLVSGAGDIKLTKDGNVLLHEMQMNHPTASLIARTATAQDDITGDGTTSNVLLIGELLKQSERLLGEGVHPRVIAEGYDLAKTRALAFLDTFKQKKEMSREVLLQVAQTALRTKLTRELADSITEMVVDAVQLVRQPGKPIDLFMVEIMQMQHRSASETRFVRGLVLDHGSRHPNMPRALKNCHILTCNVSLEYEKPEIETSHVYSSVEQKEKLVEAERKVIDDKVRQLVEFKRSVCKEGESFVVINQKGIDPLSLDMLAREGILALRRAKRRNMERLTLACGGQAVNAFDALAPPVLGYAQEVYEHVLGDEKYTFVEKPRHPLSCTILIKGPNKHSITQIKDALRDGLRAVKNAIEDGTVVAGAGAFEVAAARDLQAYKETVKGRVRLGIQAYADALLVIPKVLAENSGFDSMDTILALEEQHRDGNIVGVDVETGEPMNPADEGIWDIFRVKRQFLASASVVAAQLLLVDEVLRSSRRS